jgi:hypothetical protein
MPKMKPLKEWVCDKCGGIVGIEDGWLEWLSGNGGKGPRLFHIVHNQRKCYHHEGAYDRADMHLDAFLGPEGLQNLLSMIDDGDILDPSEAQTPPMPDRRSFTDTLRRLQIPYYEEARRYFADAGDEGYFSDQNEVSIFLPKTCKSIIERYAK